jgi:hypothetical protein
LLLVLMAAGSISAKVIYGGHSVSREFSRYLWRINIVMNLAGKGTRAKVRLTLPKENERQTIYNEHFENDGLVFYVREREFTKNRVGFWRSELLDGTKSVQYTFSAQLKSLIYAIPGNFSLPDNPYDAYPPHFRIWLDPSAFIQSKDLSIKKYLKKIVGKEKNAAIVMRKLYDFITGQVRYRSEKGSKDAKATLNKLTADCGGQSRLFAALSRAAGVPSRIVGGLILTGGVKQTTHVWVENYLGGKWIPFDVVNKHFASMPNHYLELYRGDYALIKHVGLSKFEYFFFTEPEKMPPVDNPWSLYALPIHFQELSKVLLLIPLGALVVAFFRSVVGLHTFGTFAPILLALAFREVSLVIGLGCLAAIIFFGWVLRMLLDHLKILVIPRLSIVVTLVIIFVLAMMIVGFHFGLQRILFISMFPMIIMTWTIERFSVIQIEDGTVAALRSALGTTVVSIAAYYVMALHVLRSYLFAFPELLLVIMALLLLLGRYTGIRFTELWRFRAIRDARREGMI